MFAQTLFCSRLVSSLAIRLQAFAFISIAYGLVLRNQFLQSSPLGAGILYAILRQHPRQLMPPSNPIQLFSETLSLVLVGLKLKLIGRVLRFPSIKLSSAQRSRAPTDWCFNNLSNTTSIDYFDLDQFHVIVDLKSDTTSTNMIYIGSSINLHFVYTSLKFWF
jgi:hypothetical protein